MRPWRFVFAVLAVCAALIYGAHLIAEYGDPGCAETTDER